MICPICKVNNITKSINQFGGRIPICGSCHQEGLEWATEDPFLMRELEHGFSLDEALKTYHWSLPPDNDDEFVNFVWQIHFAID